MGEPTKESKDWASWEKRGDFYARRIMPMLGTGGQLIVRDALNVTTRVRRNMPANTVTALLVYCRLNAAPASPESVAHVEGMLAVGALSDDGADAMLTQMDSENDNVLYYPIPLNEYLWIPLSKPIPNGRIDIKSSDEAVGLKWWIGGN